MSKVVAYRPGVCRNSESGKAHLYAETKAGKLWPMCDYGWNRSNGGRFSILRLPYGTDTDCKICQRRLNAGLRPIIRAFEHKTKWL